MGCLKIKEPWKNAKQVGDLGCPGREKWVAILNRVIRVGPNEKGTFEQRFVRGEVVSD